MTDDVNAIRLPDITERHLHARTAPLERPPIPDPGGMLLRDAADAFNARDYERASGLFEAAIAAGLRPKFAAMAHSCLGDILLASDIVGAVAHYLSALEAEERGEDTLWECSAYLASIYKAAGRAKEASSLQALADSVNRVPFAHTPQVERMIRESVQRLRLR
jgi:hypothetical protein